MSVGPAVCRRFLFFYLFACVLADFRFQDIIWNWAQQNQCIWHQWFSYARVGEKTESLWMSPSLLHYHSTGVGNVVFACQNEQDQFILFYLVLLFLYHRFILLNCAVWINSAGLIGQVNWLSIGPHSTTRVLLMLFGLNFFLLHYSQDNTLYKRGGLILCNGFVQNRMMILRMYTHLILHQAFQLAYVLLYITHKKDRNF